VIGDHHGRFLLGRNGSNGLELLSTFVNHLFQANTIRVANIDSRKIGVWEPGRRGIGLPSNKQHAPVLDLESVARAFIVQFLKLDHLSGLNFEFAGLIEP
jgi:hypothetical protein